jgi:hypothetical protein
VAYVSQLSTGMVDLNISNRDASDSKPKFLIMPGVMGGKEARRYEYW